jgi:hypothetical protein
VKTETLTEFLLARIAEDEQVARDFVLEGPWQAWALTDNRGPERDDEYAQLTIGAARVLAECEAKRRIVEWHKNWPVLAQGPTTFESVAVPPSEENLVFRASSQIAWLTEQKYREQFGAEPPTSPILAMLALPYADHPDYDESWRP